MSQVVIIIGSTNDRQYAEQAANILEQHNVDWEIEVMSAHRDPDGLDGLIDFWMDNGVDIFICMAGLSAALPGAVAARTTKPVIGVPLDVGPLNGIDALLSIAQMPGGVPVATMGIGKAGAKNAAHFALRILGNA